MAKVKRVGRARKLGRPKGSKNKKHFTLKDYSEKILAPAIASLKEKQIWQAVDAKDGVHTIFEEAPIIGIKSRLDECMMKFETAIAEAIVKLKESI